MRFRYLSFLLGLFSVGACSSSRTDHAEPVSPPPEARRAASSEGQATSHPEPSKGDAKAGDAQSLPAPKQEITAKAESATNDKAKDPKPDEIEIVEEKYDNGVVRRRVEGKRNAEGEFVPHGLSSSWYESGLKWTEITFRDGIKQGPQRKWYHTGAESSYGGYDNDVEHGVWTAFHPNGEKAREIHIDHGVWNGPYIEYHTNGRKNMEVTFVKGLRQGVSRVYNEDGSVAFITDYIDGVEQP